MRFVYYRACVGSCVEACEYGEKEASLELIGDPEMTLASMLRFNAVEKNP